MKKSDELKKVVDELTGKIEQLQQNEKYSDAAKLSTELTETVKKCCSCEWKACE